MFISLPIAADKKLSYLSFPGGGPARRQFTIFISFLYFCAREDACAPTGYAYGEIELRRHPKPECRDHRGAKVDSGAGDRQTDPDGRTSGPLENLITETAVKAATN